MCCMPTCEPVIYQLNKVHAVGRRIDKELGEEQAFFIDGCEYDSKPAILTEQTYSPRSRL